MNSHFYRSSFIFIGQPSLDQVDDNHSNNDNSNGNNDDYGNDTEYDDFVDHPFDSNEDDDSVADEGKEWLTYWKHSA